jgi:hypothetical protein
MVRRAHSPLRTDEWPAHLRLLIQAAERECPAGHAHALRELTSVALVKVPARGIFDPTSRGEHELFTIIDGVASRHLGMAQARAAWLRALRVSRLELQARDRLEEAAQRVHAISDTAYFYAGLAFGLSCTVVYRDRF